MRMLGASLQGADKIISDGLILLIHGRSPKRGERAPVIAKVRQPQAGSYDFLGGLQDHAWMLQLGLPIAQQVVGTHISEWMAAVKATFSGRPDIAETALQALADLNREHLAARDASEARFHEERLAQIASADAAASRLHDERMAYLDLMREMLPQQQRALEQYVAPVGRSVTTATFSPADAPSVHVDAEEADKIRAAGEVVWEPLREMALKTDGFRFHTNGLSIENPDRDGYLMAKVSDPRFEQPENPYTAAAQRRAEIIVLARAGYVGGQLSRIDIVDFVRER
ncbi:hypothetical protein ACFFGE_01815 [Brevundimonas balnearis]|uniref:Uncharacterized protein n=1 Tax=Brevundimonas balnearis TaxID=1572858 RepID=A0ABV6R1Z3_9CAUL